jgi:Phosphoesterase family
MMGGGTFGVNSDDAYWTFGVNEPSLTSQIDAAGLTWRGYYQGMPYAGYRGYCYPVRCLGVPDSDTLYIAKHNGTVYFHSVNSNPAELAKMRPLGGLSTDLNTGHVPSFSYVIPDECHDMHGAPPVCVDSGNPGDINDNWLVSTADAFVAQAVYEITRSKVWEQGNNAIVINFDEGDDNAGCCGTTPGGGRALAVVVTNRGPRGLYDATPYNHYSLLSTFEQVLGVPCLAGACDTSQVKPMSPLFAVDPHTTPGPVPASLLTARKTLDPNPPVGSQPQVQPGASGPVPGPAARTPANGSWQVVPSPNLSTHDNNLAAVSASSPGDAWAVGSYYTQSNPNVFRNLAEHWDGTRWTAVAPPNVGDQENTLFSVSSLSDGKAWAVGYYADQTFRIRTLAELWDGAKWTVVPTPNPGRARDVLFSVKAISDTDVWAVGGREQGSNGVFRTLIEHWNGSSWTVVPSPDPAPNGNELFAVTGSGPDSAWATGQGQGNAFPSAAIVEHWNGHAWSVAQAPTSSSRTYDPYAAATLGRRLLAAGDQEDDTKPQTTLSFLTGRRGSRLVSSGNVGAGENDFYAVAAANGAAWAAGRTTDPATDLTSTLIETLKNGAWSIVPTPNPGGPGGSAGFGGVATAPGGESWAVGVFTTSSSSNQTLIERYMP